MLLLQVSDYLIHEQHDTRLREADAARLASLARATMAATSPDRRTTSTRSEPGLGRGPRLVTRVLRRVHPSAGA